VAEFLLPDMSSAYVSLLLPYSITRMADLNGFAVPFQVFILAYTCWFLLGSIFFLPRAATKP
jgi:hypothetical protein